MHPPLEMMPRAPGRCTLTATSSPVEANLARYTCRQLGQAVHRCSTRMQATDEGRIIQGCPMTKHVHHQPPSCSTPYSHQTPYVTSHPAHLCERGRRHGLIAPLAEHLAQRPAQLLLHQGLGLLRSVGWLVGWYSAYHHGTASCCCLCRAPLWHKF